MKKQRKLLVTSLIMILTCCIFFAGTTFAWFSDSVTSNNNVITAGNLDVEVEYTLDGENWADLQGAEDLFQKSLWEPGHTEVVVLRVSNAGSLALKYQANLKVVDEVVGKTKDGKDIVLSDILTVSTLTQQADMIGDITVMMAFLGENRVLYEQTVKFKDMSVMNEKELGVDCAHYVIIKIDMAETVGNEANHDGVNVPSIAFGIDVVATQFNYEADSFDNLYDKDAPYPVIGIPVANTAKLIETLTAGKDVVLTQDIAADSGKVKLDGGVLDGAGQTMEVVVKGSTETAITVTGGTIKDLNVAHGNHSTMGVGIGINPYSSEKLTDDLELDGVTVFASDDIFDRNIMYAIYAETANNPNVVINDSALYGAVDLPGAGTFTATNTTFGSGAYWFLAVSGEASFTNCTFESSYCILAYQNSGKTITFTNCNVAGTKLTAENFKSLLVSTAWDYDSTMCSTNLKSYTIIIDGVAVVW